MKKPLLLACMLAMALLLSGCALIEKDEAVDLATPIISIGDIVYTKANVLNVAESYYYSYGSYYGTSDPTAFYDTAVASLKQTALERYMITKLGLDQLTDDEKAQVDQNADASMQSEYDWVKANYFVDSKLEGDELDTAVKAMMESLGYTEEGIKESALMSFTIDKLKSSVTDTVTVSQEEARTNFDGLVASAKESYTTNLSAFGTSFNAGTQTYYTPAGYRYIKNLLVRFTDEDASIIADINTQITQKQSLISSIETGISDYQSQTKLTEEAQTALDALNKDLETAKTEEAALQTQLTAATDTAYSNIASTVEGIRQRLAAGETFDALMTELGKDSATVNTTTGYAICEGFTGKDTAMVDAAMKLKTVGDITQEDVKASNGIQILSYVGDMTEGEVSFDSVKDLDSVTQLSTKQNDAYTAQLEAWEKENAVKVDTRSLNN